MVGLFFCSSPRLKNLLTTVRFTTIRVITVFLQFAIRLLVAHQCFLSDIRMVFEWLLLIVWDGSHSTYFCLVSNHWTKALKSRVLRFSCAVWLLVHTRIVPSTSESHRRILVLSPKSNTGYLRKYMYKPLEAFSCKSVPMGSHTFSCPNPTK